MSRSRCARIAVVLITTLILLAPLTATAHERRELDNGTYTFVVGFISEPAFAGEQNGLSLAITKHEGDADTPVEGLQTSLNAEVIYGDQTMALPLSPGYGQPGRYQSVFFPMAVGDYSFHIIGEIDGVKVDEMFTSSPNGFDGVQDRAPLEFPKAKSSATTPSVAGTTFPQQSTSGTTSGEFFGVAIGGLVLGVTGLWLIGRRRILCSRNSQV